MSALYSEMVFLWVICGPSAYPSPSEDVNIVVILKNQKEIVSESSKETTITMINRSNIRPTARDAMHAAGHSYTKRKCQN